MRFANKHTLTFGRLFLLLFFIANSGFTVVLYNCSMAPRATTNEMSGMSCCEGMACCTGAGCEDAARPQAPVGHVVRVDQQCLTATIAGGSLTEPTIVEKGFTGQQILKADPLSAVVYEPVIGSGLDLTGFHLVSASSNVSRSSVETYVLNVSFLI